MKILAGIIYMYIGFEKNGLFTFVLLSKAWFPCLFNDEILIKENKGLFWLRSWRVSVSPSSLDFMLDPSRDPRSMDVSNLQASRLSIKFILWVGATIPLYGLVYLDA